MISFTDTFTTPLGLFSVAVDEQGAVQATAFGDAAALQRRGLMWEHVRDADRTRDVRTQMSAYFAGELSQFSLPLAPRGTPFQHRVWSALRAIPLGETRSYRQIAELLGNSSASRAVGRANATNPICVIVPCHRVIGASGALTGFAFGEELKRRLLDHEREIAGRLHAA